MRRQLQQYVQEKKLARRICMVDYVPHDKIPALIHAMDIVVAPYPRLPFFYYSPVKVYEYLACGKPVVASQIGQIAEIIQHKKTGMLCEPGNIRAYLECIDQLIASPHLRRNIGRAAAGMIRYNHTWGHRARQLQTLMENVR